MRMFKGPEAPVSALAWTPDGRRLVVGMRDGMMAIWDVPAGEIRTVVRLVSLNKFPLRMALSPDGRILAGGSQHLVRSRSGRTG